MLFQPWGKHFGMMVSGIIQDNYHLSALASASDKVFKKSKKALCAKFFGAPTAEAAVGYAHRPKYGDTFAGWCM
jgi:hypothetical protein